MKVLSKNTKTVYTVEMTEEEYNELQGEHTFSTRELELILVSVGLTSNTEFNNLCGHYKVKPIGDSNELVEVYRKLKSITGR